MSPDLLDPSAPRRLLLEPVNPVLDLCFPIIRGMTLEVDHGHSLYLALSEACAGLERIPGLGIHAVRGIPGGQKGQLILAGESAVRLRIPAGSAALLQGLAGAELDLGGHRTQLGEPYGQALTPVSALWARTVTIHFRDPGPCTQAQLAARFAQDFPWGSFRILRSRTIRFQGRQLLGYEVAVRNLTPQASLLLQRQGFGGRRLLGCGLFVPFAATCRSKAG
jgi:CRISPR-associated protein Cas6